jgi:Fe-S-cluster containining protein
LNLDELMEDLLSDNGYLTGRRRYPRTISTEDAVAMARHFQAELDRGTEARGVAAERQGVVIACHRGCHGCCSELILIREPEAMAVAEWLERPENAETRAAFLDAYPRWRAAVGDAPQRLVDLLYGGDREAYGRAHIAQWRTGIMCAFNRDGACSIYPVRPLICRHAHAVGTSDRCHPDRTDGLPATRLEFQPVEDFVKLSRQVLSAAHHAVRGQKVPQEALCDAVWRLLTAPAPPSP